MIDAKSAGVTRASTLLVILSLSFCISALARENKPPTPPAAPAKPLEWNVFLGPWHVMGPFPKADDGQEGLETDYLGGELDADISSEAEWDGAKYRWKTYDRPVLDFHKAFGSKTNENKVAYAWTTIVSDKAQDAVLAFGSDDGIYAWLNREKVLAQFQDRPFYYDDLKANAHLKQGENVLLVKVDNSPVDWGVMVRALPAGVDKPLLTFEWGSEPPVRPYEIYELPNLKVELLDEQDESGAGKEASPAVSPREVYHVSGFRPRGQTRPVYRLYLPAPDPAPSTIRVSFRKTGYEPFEKTIPWDEACKGPIRIDAVGDCTLAGMVVDAGNGAPVQGALFTHPQGALPGTSDADGAFEFGHVDPLMTKIMVSAAGYLPAVQELRLPTSKAAEIKLTSGGKVLRGRLADAQGRPIQGANVRLAIYDPEPHDVSDASGHFMLTGIPDTTGMCLLMAAHPDYAPLRAEVNLQNDAGREAVYTMARGAILVGHVTAKEGGRPLSGIRIATGTDGTAAAETVTDAEGNFRLTGVLPGQNAVVAFSDDFAPSIESVPTESDVESEVNFELESGADITGRVTDPSGRAIPGTWVMVDGWGGAHIFDRRTYTDRDGHYALSHMPSTPVMLYVYHPGHVTVRGIQATGGSQYDLVLKPAGTAQ